MVSWVTGRESSFVRFCFFSPCLFFLVFCLLFVFCLWHSVFHSQMSSWRNCWLGIEDDGPAFGFLGCVFRTWILPSWKMLEVLKKETWYSLKCCIIGPSGAPTWAGPPLRPHSGLLAAASQLYLGWPPGTGIFHHLWKFPCNSVFLAPVLRITPN